MTTMKQIGMSILVTIALGFFVGSLIGSVISALGSKNTMRP